MGAEGTVASGYGWGRNFDDYLYAMTWGGGYGGERYWAEEEALLKHRFGDRRVKRALSAGCGLFRECETLRAIASEEVAGLEYEQKFVDYLLARLPSGMPGVRVFQGDVMHYPLPRNYYELVTVLFHTLTIFPDMGGALKRLWESVAQGGALALSFWKDTPSVTEFRKRIYTSRLGMQAGVEAGGPSGHTIIVREGDVVKHRSPIVPQGDMERLIVSVLGRKPMVHEMQLGYMLIVEKN